MDRTVRPNLLVKNTLAKALYDNKAECPDELAFRRGDILMVLEQNLLGSEGWWKCSLHGKQGMAPANRLQLLTPLLASSTQHDVEGLPASPQTIYQVPSAHRSSASLPVYEKMDGWITPPSPSSSASRPLTQELYQVPALAAKVLSEKTQSSSNQVKMQENTQRERNNEQQIGFSVGLPPLPSLGSTSPLLAAGAGDTIRALARGQCPGWPVRQRLLPGSSSRGGRPAEQQGHEPCPKGKGRPQVTMLGVADEGTRVVGLQEGLATPPSSRKGSKPFPSTECCLGKAQQLYDIPLSLERTQTRTWQESSLDNVYVIPIAASTEVVTGSQGNHLGHYNTLPNLRKSEWVYDIPVSPEKAKSKHNSQNHSPSRHVLYDIPPARSESGMQKIPPAINEGKSVNPEAYDVPPIQRRLTFPAIPLYDIPSTHDALVQHQNGNYDIPSAALSSRIDKENHQQTVYDIPKGMPIALPQKKENAHGDRSEDNTYTFPLLLSTDSRLDQDRLSVSSVDSRASTISTLSSSSTESFSSSSTPSSSSEESTKERTMELELAIETLTKLQHSVSSSVASLMIFVSSRWRYQEHLEGNIEEIHRAIDHIKVSLGEFLDFACTIEGNTISGCDSKLQARIKKQLNILTDSFQILVKTRDALNDCKWSLDVLVIKKPQNNPDDLDRFIMVARTLPDDIKRFVAIIIANGKLLFRKNCKNKDDKDQRAGGKHKMSKYTLEWRVQDDSLEKRILDKPKENKPCSEKSRVDITEDCDYSQIQKPVGLEQAQLSLSPCKAEEKNGKLKIKGSPPSMQDSKQDPTTKMVLSNICRLYFGAVQKAIAVFHQSLSRDQTPEVFIAKSKLIIMVGQKLVDALCQEALEKTNRNEILCGSSQFCGLLKNLAVATKNAAMQYPSPEAMRELQDQADGLSKYAQQFRAMMD
ncbi:cas scaffolding protein family member 4 [Sceloporus undulatus]|uniref:cas scaffolding protein family member 4 n=1 Tax=Sceloporus undulatus TaxID=8520 RepID=UPI001C4AFB11|nr:cas scaffolding protein family member 4 [Sceloporus undulatus]